MRVVAATTIATVLITLMSLGCESREQPTTQTTITGTAAASDRDEALMLTAALGPALSSDCVAPDAPPEARVSLQQAIDAVRRQLENQPSGPHGGAWEFERADAQVVLCRSGATGGEARPYWFVVVPSPAGLTPCGPARDAATGIVATCWSGTAALFVDAVDGSAGGASISGKQGPSMTESQLGAALAYATRYGWWELWKLLQGYGGQPPPADVLTELGRATR